MSFSISFYCTSEKNFPILISLGFATKTETNLMGAVNSAAMNEYRIIVINRNKISSGIDVQTLRMSSLSKSVVIVAYDNDLNDQKKMQLISEGFNDYFALPINVVEATNVLIRYSY